MSKSKNKSGNNTAWWVIGVLALIFVVVLNVASYSSRQQASSSLQGQEAQVSRLGGFFQFLQQALFSSTKDDGYNDGKKEPKTCTDCDDELERDLENCNDKLEQCLIDSGLSDDADDIEDCFDDAKNAYSDALAECQKKPAGPERDSCEINALSGFNVAIMHCNDLFDVPQNCMDQWAACRDGANHGYYECVRQFCVARNTPSRL